MPRDAGPCINPRNWHDPMPAIRALLVALDEWVTNGREPPPSRLPRIADGTLVRAEAVAWPKLAAGAAACGGRRRAARRLDRSAAAGTRLAARWCRRWTRTATRSPASACPTSPCRAARSPAGTCTRRRCRRANWPTVTERIWLLPRHWPTRAVRRSAPIARGALSDARAYVARVQEVVRRCSAIACCWRRMRRLSGTREIKRKG